MEEKPLYRVSEPRKHHGSQEWDLEQFPTDLLSSTKHGDMDHVIGNNSLPNSPQKAANMNCVSLPKVTSTGSMDMVGCMPTQEESPDKSDASQDEKTQFSGMTIADFDISEKYDKRGCCVLCKLCCMDCLKSCKKNCDSCSAPCMTKNNPPSAKPTLCERFRYGFMCPPHGKLAMIWSLFVVMLFIWGVLWAITGKEALPGGNFFGLSVLLILCSIGGKISQKLRAPPLLGMLTVGLLLRNVPKVNVAADIDPAWSGALRTIALVVILTRAGLGLDPVALKKLSCAVVRLAFIPCLVEAITVAIMSHFLLAFPWIWGFMLGFVLAAVSPAVVVPSMLSLQERGLGTDKGIPTLVIAAASVDDVLAISGFGIVLGIAFSKGNLILTIFKGPLEAIAGVVYGLVFGIMCWYIPNINYRHKTILRFAILFFGGLLATFGSRSLDIAGAGALGCLTLAFVAGLGWRKELLHDEEMIMSRIMAVMWIVMQPLLFGLIGAEVDVLSIQLKTIGLGVAVLCIGLVFRSIVSFLSVFGTGLNWKEKFFIPFAWLPKATVQAAIGSVALDTARAQPVLNPEHIELGAQLLTVAVLVIIITAPLGAIAISVTAPRLLKKTPPQRHTVLVDSTTP